MAVAASAWQVFRLWLQRVGGGHTDACRVAFDRGKHTMERRLKIATVVIVLSLLLILPVRGEGANLLRNGSFEDGFTDGVGNGWTAFSNGGSANYGWSADNWERVVWDGKASQLIDINTKGKGGQKDRYAGIYQTVSVVPGQTYRLTIHGIVRSSEGSVSASGYGYRVQYAIDYAGGTDWRMIEGGDSAWKELPWSESPLTSPSYLETYTADIKATSGKLTLFVRGWKKWGNTNQEGAFNLDGISLVGAAASGSDASQSGQLPQTGAGMIVPLAGSILGVLALAAAGLRRKVSQ